MPYDFQEPYYKLPKKVKEKGERERKVKAAFELLGIDAEVKEVEQYDPLKERVQIDYSSGILFIRPKEKENKILPAPVEERYVVVTDKGTYEVRISKSISFYEITPSSAELEVRRLSMDKLKIVKIEKSVLKELQRTYKNLKETSGSVYL